MPQLDKISANDEKNFTEAVLVKGDIHDGAKITVNGASLSVMGSIGSNVEIHVYGGHVFCEGVGDATLIHVEDGRIEYKHAAQSAALVAKLGVLVPKVSPSKRGANSPHLFRPIEEERSFDIGTRNTSTSNTNSPEIFAKPAARRPEAKSSVTNLSNDESPKKRQRVQPRRPDTPRPGSTDMLSAEINRLTFDIEESLQRPRRVITHQSQQPFFFPSFGGNGNSIPADTSPKKRGRL